MYVEYFQRNMNMELFLSIQNSMIITCLGTLCKRNVDLKKVSLIWSELLIFIVIDTFKYSWPYKWQPIYALSLIARKFYFYSLRSAKRRNKLLLTHDKNTIVQPNVNKLEFVENMSIHDITFKR